MAVLQTVITTGGGALAATVGVLTGALLTRRNQDRHWIRDRQLAAYQELLRQYATFVMVLRRANLSETGWDYDWAEWSAALTSASLVAPLDVVDEIERFAQVVNGFLTRAAVDTLTAALSGDEFDEAMRAPAAAQVRLLNTIRRSLDPKQGELSRSLGGSVMSRPGSPSS